MPMPTILANNLLHMAMSSGIVRTGLCAFSMQFRVTSSAQSGKRPNNDGTEVRSELPLLARQCAQTTPGSTSGEMARSTAAM